MRAIHAVTAGVLIVACGGSSARPAAEVSSSASAAPQEAPPEGAHEAPPEGTQEAPPEAAQEAPPTASPANEPVSWTFVQPMSIDRDGVVTMGGRVLGTLSGGALVGRDGAPIASVDDRGRVTFEGRRRDVRIVGLEVHEHPATDRDSIALRIEGNELVLGDGEERQEIENLRPERIPDVLLVSTAVLLGMAAAFQH